MHHDVIEHQRLDPRAFGPFARDGGFQSEPGFGRVGAPRHGIERKVERLGSRVGFLTTAGPETLDFALDADAAEV